MLKRDKSETTLNKPRTAERPKRKRAKRRAISAVFLLLTALFLAYSPRYFVPRLNDTRYRDWLTDKAEPRVCIVNVWHIVSFKPYIGGLGNWLQSRADEYRKGYIGVYFNVESFTPEEAESRLSRGLKPDIISFAGGTREAEAFYALDSLALPADYSLGSGTIGGVLYALPYCASGRVLVYDPSMTFESASMLTPGSADDFKRGKVKTCVCDLRAAGDLYRAWLMGKAPAFEAAPLEEGAFDGGLVQYVGISHDIEEFKLIYAMGFIEYITSREAQEKLCDIGLLPISRHAEPAYDNECLRALYDMFDPEEIHSAFTLP